MVTEQKWRPGPNERFLAWHPARKAWVQVKWWNGKNRPDTVIDARTGMLWTAQHFHPLPPAPSEEEAAA